jgi:hypothetical protein
VASKFAKLIGYRGTLFAIAAVVAAVLGALGHPVHGDGLWDGH